MSRAGLLFPSGCFSLSLPGYLVGRGVGRASLVYHQLGFGAVGVTRGHRGPGTEEVRAGCASFECGEKLKALNSIQAQLLCLISLKLD